MHKLRQLLANNIFISLFFAFLLGILTMHLATLTYEAVKEDGDNDNIADSKDFQQIRSKGEGFTSPLLECSDSMPLRVELFSRLQSMVESEAPEDTDKDGVEVSVYFRDLSNGGWFEAGSSSLYQPASLMKLPTLIAAYKKYDTTPEYFSEVVEVGLPFGKNATQNIVSGEALEQGQKMTIGELVKRTVVFSDNMAHDTLANQIGIVRIKSVLNDFGVPPLTNTASDYKISPRIYARFLRILYNATYISRESSESLLKLLSQSKFEKGIRAGLPKSVLVASKFGERVLKEGNDIEKYQLHDCGIVYSTKPYILCIMTKGPSFDILYKKISGISSTVYSVMQ